MNEAVKRCYKFISAVYYEMEKLQDIKDNERAYAVGQMKIDLTGYMMSIWSSRAALDADLATIESAQQQIGVDGRDSRGEMDSPESAARNSI